MSDRKLLWFAISAGVIGVVCVEAYVRGRVGNPSVEVLYAGRELPEGHQFSGSSTEIAVRWMKDPPQGMLKKSDMYYVAAGVGVRTKRPIAKDSPLYFADLATANDVRLSDRIPEGLRAMSVQVTRNASVTNMVLPGDQVEMLLSQPSNGTVLRVPGEYHVIAVGVRTGVAASDKMSYDTVTFQVTPDEARTIVEALAKTRGGAVTLLLCGRKKP